MLTVAADVPYITGAAPVLCGIGPQVMLANSLKEDPDVESLEICTHVDSEMIPRSGVADDREVTMALPGALAPVHDTVSIDILVHDISFTPL